MSRSIYVIRARHSVVKIGIAARPHERLKGLSTASHCPLFLDYAAVVTGDARTLEVHVHRALSHCKTVGEWFGTTARHAISVVTGAAAALGYTLERTDTSLIPDPPAAAVAAPTPPYRPVPPHRAGAIHMLSAKALASITQPGRYADGGNLYLIVKGSGSKNWVFRYMCNGKNRDMGLGGYPQTSLAEVSI